MIIYQTLEIDICNLQTIDYRLIRISDSQGYMNKLISINQYWLEALKTLKNRENSICVEILIQFVSIYLLRKNCNFLRMYLFIKIKIYLRLLLVFELLTFCLSPVKWASSTISVPNCENALTNSVKFATFSNRFRLIDTYYRKHLHRISK